uniref:Uncharacterized protein n=1 Tax=Caenorhabditis japonica TaxID=281687 RepID=A0A8R1E3R2_CAEJA
MCIKSISDSCSADTAGECECHLNNTILTDDGLLIELPTQLYQRSRHTAFWLRAKRELATISVDIRQNFSLPLIFKLYEKRNITECPIVHQNIADPMLLRGKMIRDIILVSKYLLDPPRTFYTTLEEETGVSTGSDKENERRFVRYQRDLEHVLETNGILQDG